MLQKEFEERVGRQVSDEEYVEADAMYMAAGDLDKDEFCREYVKVGQSRLVKELADAYYDEKRCLDKKCEELASVKEKVSRAADALIALSGSVRYNPGLAHALWDMARDFVGDAEVIRRKAEAGVAFTKDELKYISEHIAG